MGSLTTIHKKQSLESVASTSNDGIDIPSRNSSRVEGNMTGDNTKQVKQLSERLRVIVEETEMLKAIFWVAIEERSKLMTQVHEQVSNCLLLRDQETGQKILDKVSTKKSSEERGAGMLQLLQQDPKSAPGEQKHKHQRCKTQEENLRDAYIQPKLK